MIPASILVNVIRGAAIAGGVALGWAMIRRRQAAQLESQLKDGLLQAVRARTADLDSFTQRVRASNDRCEKAIKESEAVLQQFGVDLDEVYADGTSISFNPTSQLEQAAAKAAAATQARLRSARLTQAADCSGNTAEIAALRKEADSYATLATKLWSEYVDAVAELDAEWAANAAA